MQRFTQISQFTAKLSRLFDTGGPEALCGDYTFPLPVEDTTGMRLYQTPACLAAAFAAYLTAAQAHGPTQPKARIVAIALPRQDRFRVWAEWTYQRPSDGQITCDQVIYYCALWQGRIAVDMIACSVAIPAETQTDLPNRKSA